MVPPVYMQNTWEQKSSSKDRLIFYHIMIAYHFSNYAGIVAIATLPIWQMPRPYTKSPPALAIIINPWKQTLIIDQLIIMLPPPPLPPHQPGWWYITYLSSDSAGDTEQSHWCSPHQTSPIMVKTHRKESHPWIVVGGHSRSYSSVVASCGCACWPTSAILFWFGFMKK